MIIEKRTLYRTATFPMTLSDLWRSFRWIL